MNYRMIGYMLGWVCCFEGMFMSLPLLVALIYGEKRQGISFLAVMMVCGLIGAAAVTKKPKKRAMYAREGLVTVALSWILLSALGALPFVLSGDIPSYVDALFETVSGFTTTGSSILTEVEKMSYSCLFWRSFTHWVGGMGVLVFILAILPAKSSSASMHIMRAESPGPSVSKLVPRLRTTAMILYAIYLGMTMLQILFLLLGGMDLFDALTISFGTAGTGGFGVKNDSMASFSPYLQGGVTVFMIAFGVNFNVYYLLLKKRWKQALLSTEVWVYLGIILASVAVISINVLPLFPNVFEAVHHSFFQVGSIITTTGFATVDFNEWPVLAKTILVLLMFVGACAGSTGGGIKVSRVVILLKGMRKEIGMMCHPRGIKKVKMDGRVLEHETVRSVNAFIAIYIVIFVASLLVISIEDKDMVTNFTAVATALNNVGPGLGLVGPAGNFSEFTNASKLVLAFDMLAGRLELLPMLMLLVPSTWKGGRRFFRRIREKG